MISSPIIEHCRVKEIHLRFSKKYVLQIMVFSQNFLEKCGFDESNPYNKNIRHEKKACPLYLLYLPYNKNILRAEKSSLSPFFVPFFRPLYLNQAPTRKK